MDEAFQTARDAANRWLLDSGIRHADGVHAGAFRSWHDDGWGFAYSEVTGYGISLLCDLGSRDGSGRLLEAATESARWLIDQARVGRAFRCRFHPGSGWTDHLCSFDNGMILNALCRLHRATGDRRWIEAATDVAGWLDDEMELAGGGLLAKRLPDGSVPDLPGRWSTRTGPYQAKIALGLAHLGRITGDDRLASRADRLCRWALRSRLPDGRIATDPVAGDTYLHAHCYSIEGWLGTAALGGRPDLAVPAGTSIEWMRRATTADGGLPCRFDGTRFDVEEHCDSTAQALRLALLGSGDAAWADRLARRLVGFQCLDGSRERHGGFRYARRDGTFTANLSAHGTMFAIQALDLFVHGTAGFDWADLV